MLKVLLAVDGSETSMHAVEHVIKRASATGGGQRIHLLNVQHPLHGTVSSFVNAAQIKQYHQEEGTKAVEGARARLDAAGIKYEYHLFVGEPAEVVTRYAKEQGCEEIVIGSRGLSGISSLLLGSVATKIIHLAEVPVVLVK